MRHNPILLADSYKASHFRMYPPGTEHVYCYIESRGGRWSETLLFGLQAFVMEYLEGRVVTQSHVEEASELLQAHGLPFNRAGWQHIVDAHGGRLPLMIMAAPEGSVVPTGNALVTVENTDPALFWLPTYMETALLRGVWYPTTVATNSLYCKRVIWHYLQETADDPASAGLEFKLHDFGARGVSSRESAELGGMAHLVNFRGTDTVGALVAARRYYGEPLAGFSIPATEHSTIIAWGPEREEHAYRGVLELLGPGKMVACVSDSYDLIHAVRDMWCGTLRDRVRDSGGTLVVRPDSGDPATVVLRVLEALGEGFGAEANGRGYRVLPTCVRVIQGDGVNAGSIADVLANLMMHGWSAENVAFGMGGALLQQVDRDTARFAMKPSHVTIHGLGHDVSKSSVDDPSKASKRGRFALTRHLGRWATVRPGGEPNLLQPVFRDGEVMRRQSLADVRALSWG
jgi:nicotinamide phosphoribosyltransferase